MNKVLPLAWVERIFSRLDNIYGNDFTGKFSRVVDGQEIGLPSAMQVWAEELGTFSDWPEAIAHALKHLPERPPNAIQFRELCRHAPARSNGQMITQQPTAEDRERAKENIRKIREMLNNFNGVRQ